MDKNAFLKAYDLEDADLEAVDRFDATRIHYNKY